jgi:hypothetical protein
MINLENGLAKIGDKVMVKGRMAIFESLYNGKLNCRFIDDNSLDTLDAVNIKVATENDVDKYYKNMDAKKIQDEINKLRPKAAELGYDIKVEKRPDVPIVAAVIKDEMEKEPEPEGEKKEAEKEKEDKEKDKKEKK